MNWHTSLVDYVVGLMMGWFDWFNTYNPNVLDTPPFTPVYTGLYGWFTRDNEIKARDAIRQFNLDAQPSVRGILDNVKLYHVQIGQSQFGDGTFNGGDKVIPVDVVVGFYSGDIVTRTFSNGMNPKYAFSFDEFFNIQCVLDAASTVLTKYPGNGGLFDHSCQPNCECKWILVGTYHGQEMWLLVFMVIHPIPPEGKMTIDYNKGDNEKDGYWHHMSSILHVPVRFLTKCGCANPCPKNRAFKNWLAEGEKTQCAKETRASQTKARRVKAVALTPSPGFSTAERPTKRRCY